MISHQDATESEIEANQGFEAVWNRVQIGLQGLIGLVVAAGLLGGFGDGWLSTTRLHFPTAPLSVSYERFQRANAPSEIVVATERPLAGDTLTVTVNAEMLDHASVSNTEPRANDVSSTVEGVTYTFHLGPNRTGHVVLKLAPRRPGVVHATLTAAGDTLALPLFIYP